MTTTTHYEPLTKKITQNGQELVVCKYYGTEQCQKTHKQDECNHCSMLELMIKQLNAFEEVYLEINHDT